jgi:hypothetical protein
MTLSLTVGSMFGATITQTGTFGSPTPVATDVAFSQTADTFDFFQSAPGYVAGDILNSVTVEVVINQTITSLSITNNDPHNSQNFTYSTSGTYQVGGTDPDAAAINNAYFDFHGSPSPISLYNSGSLTLGSQQTDTNFPTPIVTVTDTGAQTSANPSAYNTTGTFTLAYDTLTGTTFNGGGGNLTATQATVTNGTYKIIYNYTAPSSTPEPATMTLFGSALLGIGFFARKRFKKQ